MQDFLLKEAKKRKHYSSGNPWPDDGFEYLESDNPDADNGDAWLDNGTSYIRRIGVLTVWDGNKTDYASILIGEQRRDSSEPRLIGVLHFDQGENCDIAGTLSRMSDLIKGMRHPVFYS